jgi:hypothetical protein
MLDVARATAVLRALIGARFGAPLGRAGFGHTFGAIDFRKRPV